ncbi:IPT/TIG domain-containing protein [Iodobacter arcticus]|uniref:IPT/TIG domain-containing protein n=1 Tax=Iodobacter arcticus TaxID=590593 RepID=A0ABW2QYV5_9NEIS
MANIFMGKLVRKVAISLMFSVLAGGVSADTVQYDYDAGSRLQQVVRSAGDLANYTYDDAGSLLSVKSGTVANSLSLNYLEPSQAPIGNVITIQGSGFSSVAAQNSVIFNGVSALVQAASNRFLTVVVPVGATTGKVKVSNQNGSVISRNDFIVGPLEGPKISGFTPSRAAAKSNVTINGANFSGLAIGNTVRFNNSIAAVQSASSSALIVNVPNKATSGPISVTTSKGSHISVDDFFILPDGLSNDALAITERIVSDIAKNITLTSSKKIALLTFKANAGELYTLGISKVTQGPISVRINRPDGTVLVLNNTISEAGALQLPSLPESGVYSIVIDSLGKNSSLTINLVSPLKGLLDIDAPAQTFNADPAGRRAVYEFRGQAGTIVEIALENVMKFSGKVKVSLLAPDGSTIQSKEMLEAESWSFKPELNISGVYRILINPLTTSNGAVSVQLKSAGDADLIADGNEKKIDLAAGGKKLSFFAAKGSTLSLRISKTSGFIQKISLIMPNGQKYDLNQQGNEKFWFDLPVIKQGGKYSLEFINSIPSSASVSIVPAIKKTLVVDGAVVKVSSRVLGQSASFQFDGKFGQFLSFSQLNASTSNFAQQISVYKPDGELLLDNASVINSLPANGIYTAILSPPAIFEPLGERQLRASSQLVTAQLKQDTDIPLEVQTNVLGQAVKLTFSGVEGQQLVFGAQLNWNVNNSPNINYQGELAQIYVNSLDSGKQIAINSIGYSLAGNSRISQNSFGYKFTLPKTGVYIIYVLPSLRFSTESLYSTKANFWLSSAPITSKEIAAVDGGPVSVKVNRAGADVIIPFTRDSTKFSRHVGPVLYIETTGSIGEGITNAPSPLLPEGWSSTGVGFSYDVIGPDGSLIIPRTASLTHHEAVDTKASNMTGVYLLRVYQSSAGLGEVKLSVIDPATYLLVGGDKNYRASVNFPGQTVELKVMTQKNIEHVVDISSGNLVSDIKVVGSDGKVTSYGPYNPKVRSASIVLPMKDYDGMSTIYIQHKNHLGTNPVYIEVQGGEPMATMGPIETITINKPGVRFFDKIGFYGFAGMVIKIDEVISNPKINLELKVLAPDGSWLIRSGKTVTLPMDGRYVILLQSMSPQNIADGSVSITNTMPNIIDINGVAKDIDLRPDAKQANLYFSGQQGQQLSFALDYALYSARDYVPQGGVMNIYGPDGQSLFSAPWTVQTKMSDGYTRFIANALWQLPALPASGNYKVNLKKNNTAVLYANIGTAYSPDSFKLNLTAPQTVSLASSATPSTLFLQNGQSGVWSFSGTAGQKNLQLSWTTSELTQPGKLTVLVPSGAVLYGGLLTASNTVMLPVLQESGIYQVKAVPATADALTVNMSLKGLTEQDIAKQIMPILMLLLED